MGTHVISAGHGYTYLTRQTMAQDASAIPVDGIGAYYAEHGEAPGEWLGTGLAGLGLEQGGAVSEAQMIALFGEGRHPDAAAIEAALQHEGAGLEVIEAATALGRPFELNLANSDYQRMVAQLLGEWNTAQGLPRCAPVPAYVKARVRTAVAGSLFEHEYGREPADAQELSGFVARESRLGSKAVAGYDLTFSPVKSVSAVWALAPAPVAHQIEAAHRAAVEDTLGWLERTAVFTRLGRNGVRQVEVRGLVAAAFVHRSSRAGDPDLHTHVAVSNKVQTLDGRWRALDGRVLFKATVAASERYNTRLEAELRERLGLRFSDRVTPGRRPVREIDGIDARLLTAWSHRRRQIDRRRTELTLAFEDEHGRPPSPVEAIEIAQQATLDTRPPKHEPRREQDQRAHWRAEATTTLGGEGNLDAMLGFVLTARVEPRSTTPEQLRTAARQVIERVQADRATWQRWHVIAETQRVLRRLAVPLAELDAAVDAVVATALGDFSIALPAPDAALVEPDALRRADGTSVYTVAGSQLYTSTAVLTAERSLLDAAERDDGRRADQRCVDVALLETTANGLTLNDQQAAFVRELATSGSRCQLALAPAGTGKTTALRVLVRAWVEDGGDVVAAAPSAAAARLLDQATGTGADTLAKLLRDVDMHAGPRIGAGTLVLVDEAGMAGTPELARLIRYALDAGASVRLVGDDRQLAAIGAGGVLRDLAETTRVASLEVAVRFADPAEAAAALGIRHGSRAALEFYLDTGRVHVGDEHTAMVSAYRAWTADRAAGRDAGLLAATRDQVAALNALARADRLAGKRPGGEVRLVDGCAASAGDAIVTKHNERRLRITAIDWVKNGDRFTVHAVRDDGALVAVHRDTGRRVTLPAGFVAEHVALGYAVTIHAAQGLTADTCHTVLTGAESREQLYVALSRARHANHVHVALPGAADEHAPIRRGTLRPPAAVDLLTRILERESAQRSATTEQRTLSSSARRLREAVARYEDSLTLIPGAPLEDAQAAPLPWLPPVPACADESWRTYLTARAEQIHDLSGELGARSRPVVESDPYLRRDLALWMATHTGNDAPVELTPREAAYRQHLHQRRLDATYGRVREPQARWRDLVTAVDPAAVDAAEWPVLATALSRAADVDLDIDRLLPGMLAHHDYAHAARHLIDLSKQQPPRPPAWDPSHHLAMLTLQRNQLDRGMDL
jgi:conjugative relaxase-like TrwC/TraI family protein